MIGFSSRRVFPAMDVCYRDCYRSPTLRGEKYFLARREEITLVPALSVGGHLSLCSIIVAGKRKEKDRSGEGWRGTFGKIVLHIRVAGSVL